ncbi:hypothetical protein C479_14853 [Halovivax asiaticus JCM 14624]|uniref:DUF7305 domain-containing protein n=1 Tax=Halovivax asiaticus JCM 14624 TaxID=1227490 RepID=M0BEA7_9EURY|nr:hypothetical protein [Halovivax asiaticus]ELZ08628.1 hypothetical protein C479_14853 [Halovivax asiaticus JCM 14624]
MTGRVAVPAEESPPDRAQAEVLGVVLLLGLVAVGSLSLMVVATGAVSDTQSQAETERIEQSFVQLSQTMATATTAGDMPKAVSFDAGESGAITKTDAGTFTIQGGNVNVTRTVGAIEYRHDDGNIVAYQAGGVFAERGNQTRVISNPPISYDPVDETLTLPITDMSKSQDLSSGPVHVSTAATDPLREASLVENDTVTLTIQSPYYRGWEEYFRSKAGDGAIRNVDHTSQTVEVKFGPLSFEDALSRGATYVSEPGGNHPGDIIDDGEVGMLPPMDETISEMMADAKDGSYSVDATYGQITSDRSFDSGTYLINSIKGGSHEFDLTTGNITLLVDGDIASDGVSDFMTVTGYSGNNQLKIYTTGNLDIQNGGSICVDPCNQDTDASRIQVYGTSESSVSINQGSPRYEGVIYVASDEESWDYNDRRGKCDSEKYQVAFQANGDFTGSLIAGSICGHSSSYGFSYDSTLNNADIDPYPNQYTPPPRITYLNVAVYEMDVDNS